MRAGGSARALGEHKQALKVLGEALDLARRLDDPPLMARATLAMSGGGITIVDVDQATVARLEDALAALGGGNDALRARLLARLSIELAYDADESRRQSASLDALALARRCREIRQHWRPRSTLDTSFSRHRNTPQPVWTAPPKCSSCARQAGDHELALQARNWRLVDLFELGDGPLIQAELDAYAALAAQARLPSLSWYVPMWRATLGHACGKAGGGPRARPARPRPRPPRGRRQR